jgi:ABC-2 type transport system ATP-binding protein
MNAALFPAWDGALAARLLDEFELPRGGRFGFLSHGQKRKVMVLLALCQGADLLIFDEPTIGLDVESRRKFLDCLLDVALAGSRTVLLSSHILSDLERVVDRVVIVQKGRMLAEGCLEDLKARMRKLVIPAPTPQSIFEEHFRVHRYEQSAEGETAVTVVDFDDERFERFISALALAPGRSVQTVGFNLEELYLELTRSTAAAPRSRSERVLA